MEEDYSKRESGLRFLEMHAWSLSWRRQYPCMVSQPVPLQAISSATPCMHQAQYMAAWGPQNSSSMSQPDNYSLIIISPIPHSHNTNPSQLLQRWSVSTLQRALWSQTPSWVLEPTICPEARNPLNGWETSPPHEIQKVHEWKNRRSRSLWGRELSTEWSHAQATFVTILKKDGTHEAHELTQRPDGEG